MKIGELARQTGLSVDTLRFYERIGLIQRPARNRGGRRDYDPAVLDWIAFLSRLAATGMRQANRVRYAALRRQGDATLARLEAGALQGCEVDLDRMCHAVISLCGGTYSRHCATQA